MESEKNMQSIEQKLFLDEKRLLEQRLSEIKQDNALFRQRKVNAHSNTSTERDVLLEWIDYLQNFSLEVPIHVARLNSIVEALSLRVNETIQEKPKETKPVSKEDPSQKIDKGSVQTATPMQAKPKTVFKHPQQEEF